MIYHLTFSKHQEDRMVHQTRMENQMSSDIRIALIDKNINKCKLSYFPFTHEIYVENDMTLLTTG